MRRVLLPVLLTVLVLVTPMGQGAIFKVEIDGIIDPVTSEFIQKSVEEAEQRNGEFLLIRLATPGGLGISMQEIIETILNSQIPVVCYVSPKGSRASSAGFFILLSADVAVMAPGTNTGAAHPIFPFGGENETLMEKVRNDALANLRSIVNRRDRNYEMAEKGVVESKSYTAQEAVDGGLIDLIAEDEQELLQKLQGMEISRLSGDTQVLQTQGETIEVLEKSFRQELLSAIANPNFALILGLLGLLGLYFELTNPGLIFPGVLGGISLLLSLLGFSLLPVSLIGVLLILLAIGLFVAEATVQGFGVLGAGGIISMTLGIIFLIDSPYPALRIDLTMALGITIPFAIISVFLAHLAVKSLRSKVTTGEAGLVGLKGTARTDVDKEGGQVFVHGELWRAFSDTPIAQGTRIEVIEAKNLDLRVKAISQDELVQGKLGNAE